MSIKLKDAVYSMQPLYFQVVTSDGKEYYYHSDVHPQQGYELTDLTAEKAELLDSEVTKIEFATFHVKQYPSKRKSMVVADIMKTVTTAVYIDESDESVYLSSYSDELVESTKDYYDVKPKLLPESMFHMPVKQMHLDAFDGITVVYI